MQKFLKTVLSAILIIAAINFTACGTTKSDTDVSSNTNITTTSDTDNALASNPSNDEPSVIEISGIEKDSPNNNTPTVSSTENSIAASKEPSAENSIVTSKEPSAAASSDTEEISVQSSSEPSVAPSTKSSTESTEKSSIEEYIPENKPHDHYDKWIWVGDSRTVGMSLYISMTYLAKSSMGLEWFKTVANELYDLEGYNIILNFGINDMHNINSYINFYNNMPAQVFEKNKVFIMAVNPVDEAREAETGYLAQNSMIEWFNQNMKANIRNDIDFIDTYEYLTKTGFDTVDGVHYDGNTYIKIYNFMTETITYKAPENE